MISDLRHLWVTEFFGPLNWEPTLHLLLIIAPTKSFSLFFTALGFFRNQKARNVSLHLLRIRLGTYFSRSLNVYGHDSTIQRKCNYFKKVIKLKIRTKTTKTPNSLREVLFVNKTSKGCVPPVSDILCWTQNLLGQLSAAEQSNRHESRQKKQKNFWKFLKLLTFHRNYRWTIRSLQSFELVDIFLCSPIFWCDFSWLWVSLHLRLCVHYLKTVQQRWEYLLPKSRRSFDYEQ